MQYYTTIQQSKNLIKLGLDFNTAGALYENEFSVLPNFVQKMPLHLSQEIPCWTIGALWNIIQKVDNSDKLRRSSYYLDLWINGVCCGNIRNNRIIVDCYFIKESIIDSMYEMVIWLLKHKYI